MYSPVLERILWKGFGKHQSEASNNYESVVEDFRVFQKRWSRGIKLDKIFALRIKSFLMFQTWKVQQSWMNYTIKVDYLIEDALRANIKQSFQEITRSIIGDGKAGQAPTFKLNLILKKREGQEIVCLSCITSFDFNSRVMKISYLI